MYQEPKLERYGTFREMTLGGGTFRLDGLTTDANDGCEPPTAPNQAVCHFS